MRPADAARHAPRPPLRRRSSAVVAALDDEQLADVLGELPGGRTSRHPRAPSTTGGRHPRRCQPDDAADSLIADLPPRRPGAARADGAGRAEDVRRRCPYAEGDRGRHDDARAGDPRTGRHHRQTLAHVRRLTDPVARGARLRVPPALEPPPAGLLGVAHQRLLRRPPHFGRRGSTTRWRPAPGRRSTRSRPPGDVQPGRRAGGGRHRPPPGRSPSTASSSHASRGLA